MALFGCSGYYPNFMIAYKKRIMVVAVTICYLAYLLLGGYIFLFIEGPDEATEKNAILKAKYEAMEKYPNVPGEAIDYFLTELSAHGVRGISADNSTKWTLSNSVLYATTLLTTIGYGHLSTQSVAGKIVCMIYTSIGIPFTLFVLSLYVDYLQMASDILMMSLVEKLGSRVRAKHIRIIHFAIIMLFIVVFCFLGPAYAFSSVETNWSYFDAIYYCFISLTTVGLGDYVPGLDMKSPLVHLYRFFATMYMLIGVTVMMFMLAHMTNLVNNYNKPFLEDIPPPMGSTERIAICPEDDKHPTYGSIIVNLTRSYDNDENETKALLP